MRGANFMHISWCSTRRRSPVKSTAKEGERKNIAQSYEYYLAINLHSHFQAKRWLSKTRKNTWCRAIMCRAMAEEDPWTSCRRIQREFCVPYYTESLSLQGQHMMPKVIQNHYYLCWKIAQKFFLGAPEIINQIWKHWQRQIIYEWR